MNILFVSHYAGRTGAPLVLLEFQRWLRNQPDVRFSSVFGAGGPLLAEFEALGTVWPSPWFPGARLSAGRTLLRRIVGTQRWPDVAARWRPPAAVAEADVILANTAVAAREIVWLSRAGRPIVWHIHELERVIEETVGEAAFREAIPHCHGFIAASEPVARMLREKFEIPADRIGLVPEFIRLPEWKSEEAAQARATFRQKHGLSERHFVVGGCGRLGWRKGSDLFILIAQDIRRHHRGSYSVQAVWIGEGDASVQANLQRDISAAGIESTCRIVGPVKDAARVMPGLDVLALTSREDPYPLVMLEAAAAGVPSIAFEGSGGPALFCRDGGGLVVPYLDVRTFAAELMKLRENTELREALGEQARARVRAENDVQIQAPRLLAYLRAAAARAPLSPGATAPAEVGGSDARP